MHKDVIEAIIKFNAAEAWTKEEKRGRVEWHATQSWIMFDKADFKETGCVNVCFFHFKFHCTYYQLWTWLKWSLAEMVSIIIIPLKFILNLKMFLWTSKDIIITFILDPERTAFEFLTKTFKGCLLDVSLLRASGLHRSNMHMILIFLTRICLCTCSCSGGLYLYKATHWW